MIVIDPYHFILNYFTHLFALKKSPSKCEVAQELEQEKLQHNFAQVRVKAVVIHSKLSNNDFRLAVVAVDDV